MIPRCQDCIKKSQCQSLIFSDQKILAKYWIMLVHHPPYSADLVSCNFFAFLIWKFISRVKFENVVDIKWNKMCSYIPYQKRKLTGINVFSAKWASLKQINVSLIVYFLVNTDCFIHKRDKMKVKTIYRTRTDAQ